MCEDFTRENYYYCMYCGIYACSIIYEEEYDDKIIRHYECNNCFETDEETIY